MSQTPSAAQSIEQMFAQAMKAMDTALYGLGERRSRKHEKGKALIDEEYRERVKRGGSSVIVEIAQTELRKHKLTAKKTIRSKGRGGRKRKRTGRKYDSHVADEDYFRSIEQELTSFREAVESMESGGDIDECTGKLIDVLSDMTHERDDGYGGSGLKRALIQLGAKEEYADEAVSALIETTTAVKIDRERPEHEQKMSKHQRFELLKSHIASMASKMHSCNIERIQSMSVKDVKAHSFDVVPSAVATSSPILEMLRGGVKDKPKITS